MLNTTILSNVSDRVRGLVDDPEPPVFVSVHNPAGEVLGAVIWTALRGINLSGLPTGLVPHVVDVLANAVPRARSVIGSADAARLFAEQYAVRTGRAFVPSERVRLHKLGTFVPQRAVGTPRLAEPADLDVLTPFFGAYRQEVGHAAEGAEADRRWLEQRTEHHRLWIWDCNGHLVALVGHQAPAFGAVRIGPVYTPPPYRGHGYASALTAHVTQTLSAAGNQVCLMTDLANPTSNKIYAAIGYEPLQDLVAYKFS
ncbi:GNAT family N-acetyltransferase [Kribbella sandramycini]